MRSAEVRKKFLDFFKARKHRIVESDSLIPGDDPTVLFTPAGMNQFKREFMGFDSGFSRAATCQRCLRTDDLDKVGKTSGHHTFFEMLGNFSFGDYFKSSAIVWAWEFLTGTLGLAPERLWVSVYKDDDEAYGIWQDRIKLPAEKIVRLGDKENFWPSEARQKGPNGPCGPCSEIFYDQGADTGCLKPGCSPACGCGRFLEVWNLVFTQYNRQPDGTLEPLPNKNIDTGMGLERLCAVMQGVESNFQTDLFVPIIEEIDRHARVRSGLKEARCAVSDHIRAVVFSIYDGVLPSNEERGYVVRKLIRKSVLALRTLGIQKAFLYTLVPLVARTVETAYPELKQRQENIAQVISSEEKNFISILKSSKRLLEEKFRPVLEHPDEAAAGRIAFQLYDTYGVPAELTVDWLREQGIAFSQEAFDQALSGQKERSKTHSSMKGDVFSSEDFDYAAAATRFIGHSQHSCRVKIANLVVESPEATRAVRKIHAGEQAVVILDKTPFYAESGGQVGDSGVISRGKSVFAVESTRVAGRIFLHHGRVVQGSFTRNDMVNAAVDVERRLSVARNHTATHMLQAALRNVLGEHVKQQGSLVDADRLRFDFTHFEAITPEQIARIEDVVNMRILRNESLRSRQMTLAQAKRSGALAFFGEKYGQKVRVVSIGDFSHELCGGTHLRATGEIGFFKILQEGSVASGVRRIEAVTGIGAYALIREHERIVLGLGELLHVPAAFLAREVEKNLRELKDLQKQLKKQKMDEVKGSLEDIIGRAQAVDGVTVVAECLDGCSMDLLRRNADLLKGRLEKAVIALGSAGAKDKAFLVVAVTPDLCSQGVSASDLIKGMAHHINGSGGGRQDFAQAGGTAPAGLSAAFQTLPDLLRAGRKEG